MKNAIATNASDRRRRPPDPKKNAQVPTAFIDGNRDDKHLWTPFGPIYPQSHPARCIRDAYKMLYDRLEKKHEDATADAVVDGWQIIGR